MVYQDLVYRIGQMATFALVFFLPLSTALVTASLTVLLLSEILQGHWFKRWFAIFYHPLVQVGAALFLLQLVGLVYTVAPWHDLAERLRDGLKFLLPIFLIPYFQNEKSAKIAFKLFFLAMAIMFIAACLKYYGGIPIGPERFSRAAVFKDHITSGLLMAFAGFLLAHQLMQQPTWRKLGIPALSLMIFYILFMNIGRSGYVLLTVLGLLFGWQYWRYRGIAMSLGVLILVMSVAYTTSGFGTRISVAVSDEPLATQKDQSLKLRSQFIKNSLRLVAERPLFGFGTGAFASQYEAYAKAHGFTPTDNPHNQYLMFAVEFGILGVTVFLIGLYRLQRALLRLPHSFASIAQGVLLALVVGCAINSWLQDFTEGYFFITMACIVFSPYKNANFPGIRIKTVK